MKKITCRRCPKLRNLLSGEHGRNMPEAFLGIFLIFVMLFPFGYTDLMAQSRHSSRQRRPHREMTPADSLATDSAAYLDAELLVRTPADSIAEAPTVVVADDYPYGLDGKKIFNPDPTRAVWMSALFPGLGQVYNRRYWKLPIIVAGFMGLGYGTSWNNSQFQDYSQAYRDILDADPNTKSYMNFFPPTTDESTIDRAWLTATMKSRKDYYRRNRDLCIICIVGLYLLCMVDAYVDASMAHFDISPSLSMDVAPTMIIQPGMRKPNLGLNWAFTF
ncbi:MAG: DUF5683 domain-containing protein [Clostridium sp.]|nr:DUF5683 domain-containing protein [Prevotella sp.]MCM1428573.1 DUF5683 domain-containing protein [Clostridium sp.]MCM1474952.1 DUF5683 domain-containing protein [Muribaculaceae bacterium]